MKETVLEYHTVIKRPLTEVFDFFSKAENLDSLTPPHLKFKILSQMPIQMFAGQTINYKIQLFGIPFYWKTRITEWVPGKKFADEQLSGPYTKWYHEHYFEEKDGISYMTDKITYLSKGWILAPLLHKLFVDSNVKQIFEYRESRLKEIFK
jgi:ligand-binding SRPBCC domain-containing protein